jgi:uncharacterized membrane protein YgdD (TMEM256/DUF423 family)
VGRTFIAAGAILGGLAVAAGAFGAHALESRLPPARLETFELAARYQMYHALALLAAGWIAERAAGSASIAAGWLFIAGALVFCGSLYLLAADAPRWLGAVTPIGGLCLLGGWGALTAAALRA